MAIDTKHGFHDAKRLCELSLSQNSGLPKSPIRLETSTFVANQVFPKTTRACAFLRRAYEWQHCFACYKVESVANTTAFIRPAAFTSLLQLF
jgi:hypothetical protein